MSDTHTITRKVEVEVEFHHVDMMRVVHNSEYLRWFEKGRLGVLEEIMPVSWAVENRIATPVVMNHCEYLSPAAYGDALIVTTRHKKVDHWDGRFVFEHSISNPKTKVELCFGKSAVTVIDLRTGRLLKTLPDEAWDRYLALR